MKVARKRVTFSRKTGEVLKKEKLEVLDMSEDEFYGPLVKMLGDAFLRDMKEAK